MEYLFTKISSSPAENPKPIRPALKSKYGTGLFAFMYIYVLLFLPIFAEKIDETKFKISPLKPNPGIYFENIGKAGLTANNWNIIVYYDMQNYWTEYDGFRIIMNKLNRLCDTSTDIGYCNAILNQLRQDFLNIQANNKLMFSNDNHSNKRSRRGLFNFVGSLHNFLWGTLDQNYADEMSDTIDKVKGNEDELLKLIKNQTSIMESTKNLLKKTDQDIKDQFEGMFKYIYL